MSKVIEATDATFDELISTGVVILDCGAPWCGPCKSMEKPFEELAELHEDVKFLKLNVDENFETAKKLSVSSVPKFFIFKDGKPIANRTGGLPKGSFAKWIAENI